MNKKPANKTFFLDHWLFNIEDKSINITANAHGFILSHIAAGTKIIKNLNLSAKEIEFSISPEAKAVPIKKKLKMTKKNIFFILVFISYFN
ncbi:MAG: hypothetical protein P1U46_00380 [Patescibacteria group bacterium]|nr:hypothetical protein [Patescibacteria group bacterium]